MPALCCEQVVVTGEDKVKAEIEVWRHLYHRHVVLLFEVIDDPQSNRLCLVLEYAAGGATMAFDGCVPHSLTQGP
jgi:hypothetical protein